MTRRDFLEKSILCTSALLLPSYSLATPQNHARVSMAGDLDDDLLILRATPADWSWEGCFQMHNPLPIFSLEGKSTQSIHIPGYIEYSQNHSIVSDEILIFALANEREERDDSRSLLARTHYKSCPLFFDSKVLIPSMNPDFNDLPDVPTWFGSEQDLAAYNYYRAWENSLVNLALVFPRAGLYTISFANISGQLVARKQFNIRTKVTNIRFDTWDNRAVNPHSMSESDGGVYFVPGERWPDDRLVRNSAAYEVLVEYQNKLTRAPLPFPFPYPNRIFCTSRS